MIRSLVAILTVIYFAVSSGVVMNVHYCMGKRQSATIKVLGTKTCGCGKSEKKGCCKTESTLVKLDDVQKASYANYTIQSPAAIAPVFIADNYITALHTSEVLQQMANAPPPLTGQDILIFNCVFRV